MAKFHINPEKGPLPCNAKGKRGCKYGYSEQEHYTNIQEAKAAYEKILASKNDPLASHRRVAQLEDQGISNLTPALQELQAKFEVGGLNEAVEYAASSQENLQNLQSIINVRAEEARRQGEQLAAINPYGDECVTPISYGNFKMLRQEAESYKDFTAVLVEAEQASPHYTSPVIDVSPDRVGSCVKTATHEHSSLAWHQTRYDTVGGSDVGVLASYDFTPPSKRSRWSKEDVVKLEKSKLSPISDDEARASIHASELALSGPLYRGTMWEGHIRDEYAKQHPELRVYNSKAQYTMEDKPWVRVNFDGLTSDSPDGEINGILEIKTGSDPSKWKNGVPLNYRAQTLYYLYATGLKHADVRVQINDGDFEEFRLYADDEVSPGSGVTMSQYVKNRVEPWFNNLRSKRDVQSHLLTSV